MKTLNQVLNENMVHKWDYFDDGSPSATCKVDDFVLESVYMAPHDYGVYINGDYIGTAFSLKAGMKMAERKYAR